MGRSAKRSLPLGTGKKRKSFISKEINGPTRRSIKVVIESKKLGREEYRNDRI